MTLRDAVKRSTAALSSDEDAAAVAVALLYAERIDLKGTIRTQADRALKKALKEGDDALIEEVNALRARVAEDAVVNSLGKRLEDILAALNATPKSRGKAPAAAQPVGKLGQLRGVPAAGAAS